MYFLKIRTKKNLMLEEEFMMHLMYLLPLMSQLKKINKSLVMNNHSKLEKVKNLDYKHKKNNMKN